LLLKGGFDGRRGCCWREAWMEEEVVGERLTEVVIEWRCWWKRRLLVSG
jgi:hypothetical protein